MSGILLATRRTELCRQIGRAVKPAPQASEESTIAGVEWWTTEISASPATTAAQQVSSAIRGRRSVTAPTAATPTTPAAP